MHHIYTRRKFFLLVSPAIIVFIAFLYGPIIYGFWLSLTKYKGVGKPEWTGLGNYARLFKDRYVWISIVNTLKITWTVLVLALPISFCLALITNRAGKRNSIYKAIIFAPYVIPGIISGLLWLFVLDPQIGLLNNFLRVIGLESMCQQWIGGRYLTPYSCAIISVWGGMGFNMAIWSMGLKSLPGDVMEASLLDGASNLQQVFYIIVPMLKEIAKSLIILSVTGSLKTFETVYQLTGGGPNHLSETIVSYMYSTTFTARLYGYGMSISVFEFLIAVSFTLVLLALTRHRIDE